MVYIVINKHSVSSLKQILRNPVLWVGAKLGARWYLQVCRKTCMVAAVRRLLVRNCSWDRVPPALQVADKKLSLPFPQKYSEGCTSATFKVAEVCVTYTQVFCVWSSTHLTGHKSCGTHSYRGFLGLILFLERKILYVWLTGCEKMLSFHCF